MNSRWPLRWHHPRQPRRQPLLELANLPPPFRGDGERQWARVDSARGQADANAPRRREHGDVRDQLVDQSLQPGTLVSSTLFEGAPQPKRQLRTQRRDDRDTAIPTGEQSPVEQAIVADEKRPFTPARRSD